MGRKLKYNKKTKVKRIPEELESIIDRISNDAKKKSIADINLLNIALSKNDCNTIDLIYKLSE